ncbi:MAG: hypothetical protein ICV76_01350 [Nitrospiraceae bacterium]|nr:hypothetical protein [Nitrospiraceae bacterium]
MHLTQSTMPAGHGYLLIALPGILILAVAVLLFESSSNMTPGDFAQLIQSLIDLPHLADAAHILVEVKTRFIWLATVLLNVSAAVYAFVLCGLIVYRCTPASVCLS